MQSPTGMSIDEPRPDKRICGFGVRRCTGERRCLRLIAYRFPHFAKGGFWISSRDWHERHFSDSGSERVRHRLLEHLWSNFRGLFWWNRGVKRNLNNDLDLIPDPALQAGGHRFDPGHVHQHHLQIQSVANWAFARLLKLGSIWVQ